MLRISLRHTAEDEAAEVLLGNPHERGAPETVAPFAGGMEVIPLLPVVAAHLPDWLVVPDLQKALAGDVAYHLLGEEVCTENHAGMVARFIPTAKE